jgi:hypothetical protein
MPAGAAGKRVIGNSHHPSFFHTRCVLACKYRRGALLSHGPYSRPEARLVVASRPNPSVTLALADSTRVRQSGFGAAALAVYNTLLRLGAELDLCFARARSGFACDRTAALDQIGDRILHCGLLGALSDNHG